MNVRYKVTEPADAPADPNASDQTSQAAAAMQSADDALADLVDVGMDAADVDLQATLKVVQAATAALKAIVAQTASTGKTAKNTLDWARSFGGRS